MKNLSILFNNLCHHSRTNVYAQAQVSSQFKMVIWIWHHFISKHHLFKTLKLKELAYVRHFSRHDTFRDFPIKFIDAVCSIGPYIGLKFKAVIPKSLWCARLELPTGAFLQFLYLSLRCIWPWGNVSVLGDTVTPWVSYSIYQGYFFGIVTYYHRWYPISLKEKGWCLMGFTFQLHWEWAWLTKINGKNLYAPVASPSHCSGKQCITVHIMQ